MKENEILDKIASLKSELNDLVDTAETEKRSLNDDEMKVFNEKNTKIRTLQSNLETLNKEEVKVEAPIVEKRNNEEKTVNKMAFYENVAIAMRAIANNKSTADLENVAGNQISLRANETLHEDNVENIQLEAPQELVEPLQAALIVDKLGVKVVNTAEAVTVPSVNSVEASIEGEITELVGKKLEFNKVKVEPFRVGLSLPFSNRAIKTADINLVSYAINLAGKAEAQLINKVMFSGEAVNGQKGAFVDALKAETGTGVDASAITYSDITNLVAKLEDANVPFDGTQAFVMSPKTAAALKSQPKMAGKSAGAAGFILENGAIDGIPVLISADVKGYIGFGVFSNELIQRVGQPIVVVDNLSRSKENITEINFNDDVALHTIRPEAFAVIKLA